MTTIGVALPVKDGERYLQEVLDAILAQRPDEILVIDSGSSDGTVQIARNAGARVIEIAPAQFGHGRTRNLAMEETSADLVAFLTQDATPQPEWLTAHRLAFAVDDRIGAVYGPHVPRPGASPMIARELTEFFQTFSPDGSVRIQRNGDPTFLSNVNACYLRACWEEIRFRDVAYAEDQAFGVDMLAAGWAKAYQPAARVWHSHDYPPLEFMRRYFDEFRGLRASVGHVEPFSMRATVAYVRAETTADRRWLRQHGISGSPAGRQLMRSVVHHTGRRLFSALGSRADRLPASMRRRLSLEARDDADLAELEPSRAEPAPLPPSTHVERMLRSTDYQVVQETWNGGAVPLDPCPPGLSDRSRLRIALVLPPFDKGSGGHNTLLQILRRLELRGHECTIWMHSYFGHLDNRWPGLLRHQIREFFAPLDAPVFRGFDDWHGADVVIATGWDTVHPVLRLPGCHARAYIVNDHEPEFFAVSSEQRIAEDTYRQGLHCIAASPWLRDLLIERYGASADAFQLGVDFDDYQPRPVGRRGDTVIYYARHATPRRAVPFGLMALGELYRRRPDLRIVLFGNDDPEPIWTTFPYEHQGVLSPYQLSWLYSQATIGLCLSLTNFSLMPKEMLACGLPCVELAGVSGESIFGSDGPLELAPLNPTAIADAMQRLIEDHDLLAERSRAGRRFVADHTWDHATDQVEAALRHALRLREGRPDQLMAAVR